MVLRVLQEPITFIDSDSVLRIAGLARPALSAGRSSTGPGTTCMGMLPSRILAPWASTCGSNSPPSCDASRYQRRGVWSSRFSITPAWSNGPSGQTARVWYVIDRYSVRRAHAAVWPHLDPMLHRVIRPSMLNRGPIPAGQPTGLPPGATLYQ